MKQRKPIVYQIRLFLHSHLVEEYNCLKDVVMHEVHKWKRLGFQVEIVRAKSN